MAVAATGLGVGVLLLSLLWALTLLLLAALSRAGGRGRLAALPVALGAGALTAALLLFPREEEGPAPAREPEIVDTFFIGRIVLLAVMSLIFLGCLFLLLLYHLMEPVYARPLQSSWQQVEATSPEKRKSQFHGNKPES